jgi:predicted negative regulator of RcsB-dependent stress response
VTNLQDWRAEVKKRHDSAAVERTRGDRFARTGRDDEARRAYVDSLDLLNEALKVIEAHPSDDVPDVDDKIEMLGMRGGILRRLGDLAGALDSYNQGADVEEKYQRSTTYNRVNALKGMLETGALRLADVEHRLRSTAEALSTTLKNPAEAKKSWLWADLGDCLALLGDLKGAEIAYRNFINMAETRAPDTTLRVLRDLATRLRESNDPDAHRVDGAVRLLLERLAV